MLKYVDNMDSSSLSSVIFKDESSVEGYHYLWIRQSALDLDSEELQMIALGLAQVREEGSPCDKSFKGWIPVAPCIHPEMPSFDGAIRYKGCVLYMKMFIEIIKEGLEKMILGDIEDFIKSKKHEYE